MKFSWGFDGHILDNFYILENIGRKKGCNHDL